MSVLAQSGPHCGSSSFGKFFMPLGTAILTAVIKLLGERGLGATTLTPTTRTAVTIKAMDSVWRMAMSRASRTCDSINAQSEHLCYSPRHAGERGLALLWRRPEECAATSVLLVRALSSGLRDSHVSSKTVCRNFRVSGVGTSIFPHLLLIAGCESLPSVVRLRDSHFVVCFPRTLIKPSHSCRD